MTSTIARIALACTLAVPAAVAQGPAPRTAPATATAPGRPSPWPPGVAPADPATAAPGVNPAQASPFNPDPPAVNEAPTIALPNDPIEPYILTKEVGPFLVLAKTFRGPDAERYALALVLELRHDGYPAYILRTKDFPGRSNIRDVPPTAQPAANRAQVTLPEKVRTYDEAAVLVGNEKTLKDSEALLHRVKKLKPKCLASLPSMFPWQQGLAKAIRTTNPYVPAQDLFAAPPDPMIARMNQGPHSVFNCPGRYTLQIAEFGGRSSAFVARTQEYIDDHNLKGRSPLATAHADAETLADTLMKDEDVRRMGYQAYVYHDRTASRVMIGAFNSPDDPAASKLHDQLLRMSVELLKKKNRPTPTMIVPANQLTDLEPIKPH